MQLHDGITCQKWHFGNIKSLALLSFRHSILARFKNRQNAVFHYYASSISLIFPVSYILCISICSKLHNIFCRLCCACQEQHDGLHTRGQDWQRLRFRLTPKLKKIISSLAHTVTHTHTQSHTHTQTSKRTLEGNHRIYHECRTTGWTTQTFLSSSQWGQPESPLHV